MNTIDSSYKNIIKTAVILFFLTVVINHLIFAFSDTKLTTTLDSSYGHDIYETHATIANVLSGTLPLKTLTALPNTNLAEIYIATSLTFLPKSLVTFKMLHLLPLLLGFLAIYLIASNLKNPLAGLLALLFAASSPGIIAFSKQIWPHFYLSIGLLWGILFILKSDFGKHLKPLLASTAVLLITTKTHYAAFFYVILILTPAFFCIKKDKFLLLAFWIIANTANIFATPPTSKIIIIITAIVLCFGRYKNKKLRNWVIALSFFTLFASLNLNYMFIQTDQNPHTFIYFTKSFYFISFFAPLSLVYFITAFMYLSKHQSRTGLLFTCLIVPEAIMLCLQLFEIYPTPRGLNTYILLFAPIFILSGLFFATCRKKVSLSVLILGLILFIIHNFYLPNTNTSLSAKKTLILYEKETTSFGKNELTAFMQNLPNRQTVGVLHPFIPSDVYPGERSFVNETSLWLMAKKDTKIISIINPKIETPSQIMLFSCDYFILEKTANPTQVITDTLTFLDANQLFEIQKEIECDNKKIIIYRRKKISEVIKTHIADMLYTGIKSYPPRTKH